jgi:hypothetical protein
MDLVRIVWWVESGWKGNQMGQAFSWVGSGDVAKKTYLL